MEKNNTFARRSFGERFRNSFRPLKSQKVTKFSEERREPEALTVRHLEKMRQKDWTEDFSKESMFKGREFENREYFSRFKDKDGAVCALEQTRKDTREILCVVGVFMALALGSTSCACIQARQVRKGIEQQKSQNPQRLDKNQKIPVWDWQRKMINQSR